MLANRLFYSIEWLARFKAYWPMENKMKFDYITVPTAAFWVKDLRDADLNTTKYWA